MVRDEEHHHIVSLSDDEEEEEKIEEKKEKIHEIDQKSPKKPIVEISYIEKKPVKIQKTTKIETTKPQVFKIERTVTQKNKDLEKL